MLLLVTWFQPEKNRRADGGKKLIKSNHSYKNVIALLLSIGAGITYDALMKRVARALVEDSIAEIRIPKSSAESEVSSLSPHKQANDSLTSENMAKATLHVHCRWAPKLSRTCVCGIH